MACTPVTDLVRVLPFLDIRQELRLARNVLAEYLWHAEAFWCLIVLKDACGS